MSKPTPVPWEIERTSLVVVERSECRAIKAACSSHLGVEFTAFCDGPNRDANADFICRAVNAHDELLAALEAMLSAYAPFAAATVALQGESGLHSSVSAARAAIAKAKAGK